jgi:hypothetical protein
VLICRLVIYVGAGAPLRAQETQSRIPERVVSGVKPTTARIYGRNTKA